jgi:hypothetical protein
MRLEELAAIEQEVTNRGYRVRFLNGTDTPQYLPELEENGAPDRAGAGEWATRLAAVAKWKNLHEITVVGPDLEPVDAVDFQLAQMAHEAERDAVQPPQRAFGKFGRTSSNPMRDPNAAEVIAQAEAGAADDSPVVDDPDTRHAESGIPVAGGVVLTEENGVCLVGDQNAQVYVCPREALEGVAGISWKPKVKRFENVVMGPGTDGRGAGASIPWLTWTDGRVSVRAAFHSPSGQWFTLRK